MKIHNSNNKFLDMSRAYIGVHPNKKPNGLWYSIEYSWHHFLAEIASPPKIYDHSLDIDMSRLLQIKHSDDLNKLYLTNSSEINWMALKQKYSGFELINQECIKDTLLFELELCQTEYNKWLFVGSLDCDGGCIWDLDAIKNTYLMSNKRSNNSNQYKL